MQMEKKPYKKRKYTKTTDQDKKVQLQIENNIKDPE